MTPSKIYINDFLTKFLHDVGKLVLKGLCKFQVDIPINARVTVVQSLENNTFKYIYIVAAMLVGIRLPTSPFFPYNIIKNSPPSWPITLFLMVQ